MKIMMIMVSALLFSTCAQAHPDHDAALQKAATAIVANGIGHIRGGFRYDEHPIFVRAAKPRAASAANSDTIVAGSTSGRSSFVRLGED